MDFKLWLEYEEYGDMDTEVNSWLEQAKRTVLSSMRMEGGHLVFKFPSYQQATPARPEYPQVSRTSPMALAAHTEHPGKRLAEGFEKEGGKGKLTYQAGVDAGFIKPFRANKDVTKFQKTLDSKIHVISRDMGLLFETEVFIALITAKKLKPVNGHGLAEAKEIRTHHLDAIKGRITNGAVFGRIVALVRNHGIDLANQMYDRAMQNQNLQKKCNGQVTEVEFTGGSSGWGVADIADIKIGCDLDKMGFATKFTSEAKIAYRSLIAGTMYSVLGGTNPTEFDAKLKEAMEEGAPAAKQYMIGVYYELASNMDGDPAKFVEFLNYILTAGKNTFPAARNYTRNTGGANWSVAMQRDFKTSDMPGTPLDPKDDAVVTVSANQTYVKLLYKLKGGSRDGTYVTLEPDIKTAELFGDEDDFAPSSKDIARVVIKVNNIATDRFNNNQSGRFDKKK